MDLAFGNVTVLGVVGAIGAGIVVGVTIAWLLRDAELLMHPLLVGWQTGLSLAWIGFLFYTTQTIAAILSSDPLWPRVYGRYAMFLVMTVTSAVVLALLLERRRRNFERKR